MGQRDKPWHVRLTGPLQAVKGCAGEETWSNFFFRNRPPIAWRIIRGIFGLPLIQAELLKATVFNPKSSCERWTDAAFCTVHLSASVEDIGHSCFHFIHPLRLQILRVYQLHFNNIHSFPRVNSLPLLGHDNLLCNGGCWLMPECYLD